MRRKWFALHAVMMIAAFGADSASAEAKWPSRPVRLVVPVAAGGPADTVARAVGQKLSERWGQSVIIDNKPGANTAIGASEVARAAPDGYTLLQAVNSTLTVNPFTFTKLSYNVQRDFTPISLVATVPIVLFANEKFPAKTFQEFLSLARAHPGKYTIGGGTVGLQLAVERLSRDAKIQLVYVPYKSGSDVTRALAGGDIDLAMDGVAANLPFVKQGKMRALATSDSKRVTVLPEVPTLGELGLKNSDAPLWHAIVAPAGLPREIQQRIQIDLRAVLEMPDIKKRFLELGLAATSSTPDQLKAMIDAETGKLGPLIKELGLKMD
ncbi:tripartite tricarboxylate transporter substrate binding protein [Cupriavidus necator]|uniref:Tripartite tricarboxylate transporter substrate binding protein n=1 Tax=Cupriavidus necator TaxID=106590 RepID=A0A1U9UVC3_CUPNE|nr:tripartite tricarboxylate transporter substrate binding protein [Cupriavidus necator]AQV96623.1 tripartite tricarboxylate transporter substrate binding protein [Cupriavidus necator]